MITTNITSIADSMRMITNTAEITTTAMSMITIMIMDMNTTTAMTTAP